MVKSLRDTYFEQFKDNLDRAVEVTRRKNEGYTAGLNDNYSNFRFAALMSSLPGKEPVTVAQTILSRMADKISRYKSLSVRPSAAYDESMEDTLHDLMVYSNILLTWEQLGRPDFDAVFDDDDINEDITEIKEPVTVIDNSHVPPEAGIAPSGKSLASLFKWTKKE